MQLPIQIPFAKEIAEHRQKIHNNENITVEVFGMQKNERLKMPYCNACKKVIGTITLLSKKKRRRR